MPTSFGEVAHHLDDVVDRSVSLKIVVFVVTRNPASRACRSRRPRRPRAPGSRRCSRGSRASRRGGRRTSAACPARTSPGTRSSRSALVQSSIVLLSSSIPATTSSMPLKTSGSPPQIETTGAGHCTPASMHSSTDSRALVRLVLADLPAADARDVAGERRLEHQDERVALALALLLSRRTRDLNGGASGNFID